MIREGRQTEGDDLLLFGQQERRARRDVYWIAYWIVAAAIIALTLWAAVT